MWFVLYLCYNTRFGFGFHYSQPFLIVNYVFSGYIAIEKYSFNACVFAPNLNRFFSLPSTSSKFIVSK